jgi:hypothetical protein
MTAAALDEYIAGIDPRTVPMVRALDGLIRGAHPELDVAIKYGLLMYALRADWRTWVCAVDARPKGVGLRFLYGVLLDDPKGVLRSGSSVLKTWDLGLDAALDEVAIRAYVDEAVSRYDEYKANTTAVLEASRAAAKPARPQRTKS